MRNTEQKFFERAKQVAALSDASYSPTGCVAVYRGVVIAAGCNSQKPIQCRINTIVIAVRARRIISFQRFTQKSMSFLLFVIWISIFPRWIYIFTGFVIADRWAFRALVRPAWLPLRILGSKTFIIRPTTALRMNI
mgnify:CR=1 FL=1